MNYLRQSKLARFAISAMLCLVTVSAATAQTPGSVDAIAVSKLNGSWQATLSGSGGCALGTFLITFTLANGSGPATLISHSQGTNPGCGNVTVTGQTFAILSLDSNGSGTASVGCGSGCGFNLSIQVMQDGLIFNMVDVTDGGNFWEGTAIKQS
jgi:hypothetical protein